MNMNPLNAIRVLVKYMRRSKKSWKISQAYELKAAIEFMNSEYFRSVMEDVRTGKHKVSVEKPEDRNELLMREFFDSDELNYQEFIAHIAGKSCMDIGPCIATPLVNWDVASARYVIEPLLEKTAAWQTENYGYSAFDGLTGYSIGGEHFIEELEEKIDGAIYCRNCIDHSPQWPFILCNIARYAAPGCRLMLWNDIYHGEDVDEGHYNITQDVKSFKRLIDQLGFSVIREYQDASRLSTNWGCFAIKR